MSDPGILDEAVTAAATGTGVGGGFFALRWLVQWLTGRLDKRQAQLDAEHDALDMSWKDYRILLEKDRQETRARMEKIDEQNGVREYQVLGPGEKPSPPPSAGTMGGHATTSTRPR